MALITKQFHIGGMTCVNCQNTIARKLRGLPGIEKASVNYQTGIARILFDPGRTSLRRIEQVIEDLGYEVLPEGHGTQPGVFKIMGLLAVIIVLYVLLEHFGVLNLLVPSQLADSSMGFGMLFVVGLLTSVHCIAMCGGINLSQCLPGIAQKDSPQKYSAIVPSALYNLGRMISYTTVGFFLGLAGMVLGGKGSMGIPVLMQGILKLIAGTVMVIMGINMLGLFPWLRRLNLRMPDFIAKKIGAKKAADRRPFMIGLLNGLMPCGPLQSMQILALASGDPFAGALSMCMFCLGTVPLMLGLGTLVSALGKRFAHAVMNMGAVLVAVLGLAMLSQGGSLSGVLLPDTLLFLVIGLCMVGVAASLPLSRKAYRAAAVIVSLVLVTMAGVVWQQFSREDTASDSGMQITDGVQLVDSTLQPGRYPAITVRAGVPVKWTIDAPKGSINGCNYKMFLQEYGIEHTFTEGENVIEFTPTEPGTVSYTCWMGMIRGSVVVTESADNAQGNAADDSDSESNKGETDAGKVQVIAAGESLAIPTTEITETATFYPIIVDGTRMEVLAIKAPDGTIRTALNTCQMCYASGAGYYIQKDEYLICQNCGSHFTADQVEKQTGGCNPWPILAESKTVTEDIIQISYNVLKEASAIFADWKLPEAS